MRKKIFHIRESNIWGSPERLIFGQINNAGKFDYVPVTYRKGGKENSFAREIKKSGIGYFELKEYFTGDLSTVKRLSKIIVQLKPALIVTHDYKSNLYGYLASKMTDVPHLIHFHGFTSEDSKTRIYNKIDVGIMRRVSGIITVSSETKKRLIDNGIDESKIEVVINAVPDSAFEKIPFDKTPFNDDNKLIVSAGRLSYEKGYDIFIEALHILDKSGENVNTIIYGDGPERAKLQEKIDNYKLKDKVILAGFIDDLRGPFGVMEFLVIPSRSEGFPLVLLEAWAQGASVVATPVGGLPGLITNLETGLLASEVSAKALAETIKEALSIYNFKSRCGEAGKKLTKEQYNFNVQVRKLEEIYERFIG